jgi:hypothetical protein
MSKKLRIRCDVILKSKKQDRFQGKKLKQISIEIWKRNIIR